MASRTVYSCDICHADLSGQPLNPSVSFRGTAYRISLHLGNDRTTDRPDGSGIVLCNDHRAAVSRALTEVFSS